MKEIRTCIRKVASGQRLKRYPFWRVNTTSAVFGAEAEKHRRSRAAAAKRYKRKARWRRMDGIFIVNKADMYYPTAASPP